MIKRRNGSSGVHGSFPLGDIRTSRWWVFVRRATPIRLALALPFLLLVPTASNAALMSAQDLVTACSSGDATARATCNGYLMAATDAVLLRESNGRANGRVCVPPTVSVDQVRDAVLGVAEVRRVALAPSAVMLVVRAMHVTWPCDEVPKQQ